MDQTTAILVLVVTLPIAFIAAMIVVVVRRRLRMNQLLDDGIETRGTVVRKLSPGGGSLGKRHILYRYTDEQGISHSHRSMVEPSVYRKYGEGSPIPVVYSASKPAVSAPKYLVEQVRAAKKRKAAR